MVQGELTGKAVLIALSAVAVNVAVFTQFNYDIIGSLIPQYAKWIYLGAGALGAWTLFTVFRR